MANQPKKYKKFVATAATATLVASAIVPVASAASFSDVSENNEFAPYIDALTEAGIINGYPSTNTFKPGAALTRGQVVKMLGRWVESNGVEIPSDWNTKARFTDVPTNHKDQELVKYAALVADEGVFGGAAGKLMAGNNITRQQMAKVLNGAYAAVNGESLIEIAEGVDNVRIPDLSSARAEFEDAIQALMDLEISSTNSGNFRPLENVTRAQFSKFLYNTINFEAVDVAPFEVKAVNSTTVEVIFDQDIENIDKVKFAIEGLDIKGAVVKQTSKRTAVLTTSEQKGGTEYTVTVDGEKAGTFVGIAAVIPTAIKVNTQSVQGVIGEEVTLSAAVTVPEGQSKEGVSVTFNIVNDKTTNEKVEVEAFTNAEGVATYKYTRYYASEDQVAAYATKKSSVVSNAKVYWANKIQLAVTELTTGNELANETKKSYKVTGAANSTYYIAIKENLNVTPDKVTDVKVQNHGSLNFVTPYELSTGGTQFATVTTNANGEGTFTVYGSDLSATPIVYAPESTPAGTNATTVERAKYNALDLQAQAPTVKFSKVDRLAVTVKAEGTADAAEYDVVPGAYNRVSTGGRAYTVTVTDKDGKVAPEGTVAYVTFKTGNVAGDVYFSTGESNFTKVAAGNIFPVTVGKEGKAAFRVAGKGATTYAKPTVFLNTAGDVTPVKLDTADVQQDAEVTYFKSPVVVNATLTVKDQAGRVITSQTAGSDAYFEYQSVDQNGFAYKPSRVTNPGGTITVFEPVYSNGQLIGYQPKTITNPPTFANDFVLAFDVTSTFGNAIVKDASGTLLNAVQNQGSTKTYHVTSNNDGKAVIRVTSQSADTVSVNVTGASNILPTTTASVAFTRYSSVGDVTGNVTAAGLNTTTNEFALDVIGSPAVEKYNYTGAVLQLNGNTISEAAFEAYLAAGATVTATLKDGVYTFNVIRTQTTAETGLTPIQTVQNTTNLAIRNHEVSGATGTLTLDIDTPAIGANDTLVIATNGSFPIVLDAGTLVGNLQVNAPNSTVTNNATVQGTTTILDVDTNSFINAGTLNNVVISDGNGARFVNNGTINGTITIATTFAVKLEGNINKDVIVTAASAVIDAPNGTTIIAPAGTVVKNSAGQTIPTVTGEQNTAQKLVKAEADKITASPSIANGKIVLPTVANGYTVAIKSSDKPNVIAVDGTVTATDKEEKVKLVFTVTSEDKKYSADTVAIEVLVPAKEVTTPEENADGETAGEAPTGETPVVGGE